MFNSSDQSRVFTLPRAILLFFALTTLGFGIFFVLHFTPIFQNIVRSQLILSPGTQGYEAWSKPQISTYIRFYLFSVLNPEEVEAGGKPRLEQIGPFVYREELERVDEDFSKFGNVNFRTRKFWYPISEDSVSLDTLITTLDIPQFAAAESARGKWSEFMMRSTLSWRPSLFTQKTARELLFDGFSDPLLTAGAFFNPDSKVPLDKFGWFYGRNGTTWADDVIGMATGEKNYTQLGEIKTWKNSTRTHYSGECGQLKGSASGFLPVDLNRTSFDFFSTDICRPIRFEKSEEFIHNMLPVHKFSVIPMETFGNESTNPENICYNTNHPAGIHNSTGCKDAGILPVFVSLPHFLDADPSYLEQFQPGSLNPDPEQHSAYMILQPDTSIPVQVKMRLQIILQLRKNENLGRYFENLSNTFLPVLWFDAGAETTPDLEYTIWFLVNTPSIVEYIGMVLSSVGLALCLLFLYVMVKAGRKERETIVRIKLNDDELENL